MTNKPNRWIKGKMRELRRGRLCEKCQSPNGIEFHHRNPTALSGRGRGRKERYYDIVRNPKDYQALCRACHLAMHDSVETV